MRRATQLLGGLAALAATVAVVVGVPVALVEFVGWPLPTTLPTLDELQRAASMGITEATVIKTLAVVVWLAWSQVTMGIAAECVALVRRRPVRAWGLLPGVQVLGARLVAGMLLIATTVGPRSEAAARPLEAIIGQVDAADPSPVPVVSEADVVQVAAEPSASATTVGERASWWQLAEDHLGDGLRWREIRELNVGRQVAPGVEVTAETEQLEPGWSMLVPDGDAKPPTRGVEPRAAPAGTKPENHTVQAGEHFWKIAEDTLTAAWDRAPTDEETASYWRDLIEDNREQLVPPHDPDVIYPGQVFDLPETPAARDQADGAGGPTVDGRIATQGPEADDAPEVSTEPRERAGTSSDQEAASTPDRAGDWASALTGSDTDAVSSTHGEPRTAWGTPAGLAGGVAATAILGAGLGSILRRRRRAAIQRHVAGLRIPTPSADAQRTEARLAAAAPSPERLTDMAALLASIPSGVAPVLVTTSDDGTVRLLFSEDDQVPTPPEPWELSHDGEAGPVGWQARIGSRGVVRSIGLPLLVTLGRTGPTTVLANVGAMRTLAVRGNDADVLSCLRRFAIEAAVSPISGPLEVVVDDERLVAGVPGIRVAESLQEEVDTALEERVQGIVDEDRTIRMVVSRVQAPHVSSELRAVLGVVIGDSTADAAWVIQAEEGEVRLNLPDGAVLDLQPPEIDLANVNESLEATRPVGTDPAVGASLGGAVEPSGTTPDEIDGPTERDRPWCEVQVLGRVRVLLGGQELSLSPQQRELLAYLAFHRGAGADQIEDAIWAGRADDTGQRLRTALTTLRSTLGDDPDGQPLVPRRTGPGQGICLSEQVGTDLDRALELASDARTLEGEERLMALGHAIGSVRGAPFQNVPANWTTALTHVAIARLQEVALHLARALREAGRLHQAEEAVRQGLLLCDPSEMLYLEWAQIESARGRPDRIRALEARLQDLLAEDADGIEDEGPSLGSTSPQLSALG